MSDWVRDEAARQRRQHYPDALGSIGLAESCLRAGDEHGYRRGLLEAAELWSRSLSAAVPCNEQNGYCFCSGPDTIARHLDTCPQQIHRILTSGLMKLRALADARADSGQGD